METNTIVQTAYGKVQGVDMGEYIVFKGVPYAKPPVGELRWKPPVKPDAWDGVYQADTFKDRGWQESETDENPPFWKVKINQEFYPDASYTPAMSEDTLYLNIWTPAKQSEEKLSVAFWIHGGGFGSGWSSEMEFDGAGYCKRNVILVTIEYRLGMFGNLAHEWLNAENEHHVSGNYGMMDQIAALTWVYENIEAFGGDPKNITVFGQSAGAMSSQLLVSTEFTKDMISKAIFQSGGCHHNVLLDGAVLEHSLQIGKEFVEFAGASSIEELRAMPAEYLEKKTEAFSSMKNEGILFLPTVDGYIFKEDTTTCMDNDHVKNIPYMIGSNKNDMLVTPEMLEKDEKSIFYTGAIEWSQLMDERHHNPSYLYYLTRQLPGDEWGAFHGAELWYMFDTMDRCWRPWTEEDYILRDEIMDYWTSFMRDGVPTSSVSKEAWRPCSKDDPFVKELK